MNLNYHILTIIFILLNINCHNSSNLAVQIRKLIIEHKYDKALALTNKAISQNPDSIIYNELRLYISIRTNLFKQSVLDADKIINYYEELQNQNKINKARGARSYAQQQLGNYPDALLDLNYLIKNIDSIELVDELQLNKATVLTASGDSTESRKLLLDLLSKVNPSENHIKSMIYAALSDLTNDNSQVKTYLDSAIFLDQDNSQAFGNRGFYYTQIDSITPAISDFRRALSIDPYNAVNYYNIGIIFETNIIDVDSGIYYYHKAIEMAPDSPNNYNIYISLADLMDRLGENKKAKDYMRMASSFKK